MEGELFHELSPGVRGCLKLLDVILSVTFVMQDLIWNVRIHMWDTSQLAYMHIVLANQLVKSSVGSLDMLADSFIDNELEF